MGRRGTRCKELLYKLRETREYWKIEKEELDRTV